MPTNCVETEYQDIVRKNAWTMVYQKLHRECQAYPFTCVEARKPEHKSLNRYRDVNPYDHSRIVLQRSNLGYINANLVTMDRANRKYILTQGPLAFTIGHFWLMVWEQNSRGIIMLNRVIEKNEVKCHWYWPQKNGEEGRLILRDVQLQIEQTQENKFGHYIIRHFTLTDIVTLEEREVIQFHYTMWPDFGVPESPVAFMNFLELVRDSGVLKPDVGPAVVHCSAGIGRSGTFCLVDSCLVIIENEGFNAVNVQEVLLELRKGRMGLIQTPDQLRFSYEAIIEGAKRLDPDYVEDVPEEDLDISTNDEEEWQSPPPPPPRGASLITPPPRKPLPAIPSSASLGNMSLTNSWSEEEDSSDSECTQYSPLAQLLPATPPENEHVTVQSQVDTNATFGSAEESIVVRRRKARDAELSERVSAMKRRALEADRLNENKGQFYIYAVICGLVLVSAFAYTYFSF